MSPRPVPPRMASISACTSTSPSEWPARPRGWSSSIPPRTSGTPSTSACASNPVPTRSSAKRHLPRPARLEDGDRVVAGAAGVLDAALEVAADVLRHVRVGGECDRDAPLPGRAQEFRLRVEASVRLVQAGGRDLEARAVERVEDGAPVPRQHVAAELDQVRGRERVEKPGAGGGSELVGVEAIGLLHPHSLDGARLGVDRKLSDVVDGAEQEIPGIRLEQRVRLLLAAALEVDLEPELDRQAAALGLEHRLDVRLDRVDAALDLVRDRPERTRLDEVVDVLGEADLVDAARGCGFDPALDGLDVVGDRLVLGSQVHVVVDDHPACALSSLSQASTCSRSASSVTLSSRRSPSTIRTRPPEAST